MGDEDDDDEADDDDGMHPPLHDVDVAFLTHVGNKALMSMIPTLR